MTEIIKRKARKLSPHVLAVAIGIAVLCIGLTTVFGGCRFIVSLLPGTQH